MLFVVCTKHSKFRSNLFNELGLFPTEIETQIGKLFFDRKLTYDIEFS